MTNKLTQTADLNATITTLQKGLTAIPLDQAIALIESWQQQLQGADLAEDLDQLKQALSREDGMGDGSAIANLLVDLGEDTAEQAEQASGEAVEKVKQIAALLVQAGASLK